MFFDLSRIASLGAIFYILMDIAIQWGVFRYVRKEVKGNPIILLTAIFLDIVVLGAFIWIKIQTDMLVIWVSIIGLIFIFTGERWFLVNRKQ